MRVNKNTLTNYDACVNRVGTEVEAADSDY